MPQESEVNQKGLKCVELSSEMTYSQARELVAQAWPHLPVLWYRPTLQHYKEGYPSGEELEIAPDEQLAHSPGRQAVLRGNMTLQQFHSAIIRAFDLETNIRGTNMIAIWMTTLDAANDRMGIKSQTTS
jgi:hypothetical protein